MFIIIPTNEYVSSIKLILTCRNNYNINFILLTRALVGILIKALIENSNLHEQCTLILKVILVVLVLVRVYFSVLQ